MKKRMLSILLCVCLALALLPAAALADGVTDYDVWVGGVRVTSANAGSITGPGITGTVRYDAASGTLTLDGASITGTHTDGNNNSAAIYAATDLTIALTGASSAVGPAMASGSSCGVYGTGTLNIAGFGILVAIGGGAAYGSYGIYDNDVTISGSAEVTATGGKAGCSYGVYGRIVAISGSARVTATGGQATTTGGSCGIYSSKCVAYDGSINISDSARVTATGGQAVGNNSCGMNGNTVAISGGTVDAVGGEADSSYGIFGAAGVAISGGTVTAVSGKAGSYSFGVHTLNGTVIVSGGSLTAVSGEAGSYSFGVFGGGPTTVNNSSDAANDGLLIARGETRAAATAPTCGSGSAALTGVNNTTIGKFAVWGVSNTYTVLDSTLDLSTWSEDSSHWSTAGGYKTEIADGVDTLTLKNVIINASDVSSGDAYGVKLPSGSAAAAIKLEGVNVVSAGNAASGNSYGIYRDSGNVAISGNGALYPLGGSAAGSHCGSCGLYCETGDVILSGGTLVSLGGSASSASWSCGVDGGNSVTVSGGTVTAVGGAAANGSCGMGSDSTDVAVSGGTVTAVGGAANGSSVGIDSFVDVSISGGAVTAVGGSATGRSYGVYSEGGGVTLSGGIVTAVGGAAANDSYGVYSGTGVNITVDANATVTAVGGSATGETGCSYGVYSEAGSVTVSGGSLTAAGGSSTYSYGVDSKAGGVTVSGGSLAAVGGSSTSGSSCGVGSKTVAVSGGSLTAAGGLAGNGSYGVFNGAVAVSGGTAIASGNTQAVSKAPNLTGYTAAHTVTASNSTDGSSPADNYDANNISNYKYLKVAPVVYALTVNLNGGSGAAVGGSYAEGTAVSIDAGAKSGYTFSGWTATGGGAFANASSAATTYTMPAGAATVTANWTANSASFGGTTTVSISSGTDRISASVFVSGGIAALSVTDAQANTIAYDAKTTGTVEIDVSGLRADTIVIPSKLLSAVSGAALETALRAGTVTLDKTALDSVADKGGVSLSVESVNNSKLTGAQRAALGSQADSATVVDVDLYAGGSRISTFSGGTLRVSVPYTLKSGETPDGITVWFINDDGTIEPKTASYADGRVTFTTEHLSRYLLADFPFADVAESAWCYGGVAYAYNHGLFAGISDTAFSPDTSMTRQMLWMVLARMDGKAPANMDEAKAWAVENRISDGSNSTDAVTREQLAALLYRYAQYKGCDTTQGGMAVREFTDYHSISGYALPALGWAVNAGLVKGNDNQLLPSGSATRAQVATILQRFCQNAAS